MRFEPSSDRPVFLQIADRIREAVAAGVFRPGDTVPSIRAQAVALKINPNTVKRAYEELQREGLLEFRAGLGLFVTEQGEASARVRTVEAVRAAMARAVRAGLAAELSRAEIDAVYAGVWAGVWAGASGSAAAGDGRARLGHSATKEGER